MLRFISVFICLCCVSCSSVHNNNTANITSAQVELNEEATTYQLSWSVEPVGSAVSIEWSDKPDFQPGEGKLLEKTTANEFTWAPGGKPQRRYFALTPEKGESVKTAVRLLALEGGRNFRDLGGYETTDGRVVKWGHVFRSGVMHELTDNDYTYLSDLGISVICDFRDKRERDNEPTDWKAGDVDYKFFTDPPKRDPSEHPIFASLLNPKSTPEDVKNSMAAGYSRIAKDEIEGYTAMFSELTEGNIPLAFNCSAGKDRAGTAAALILTALGVSEKTIVEDYALSDDYVDYFAEFMSPEKRAEAEATPDHPYAFLFKLPEEKVAPLLASDPIYIETSFADLKKEYGSVLDFIQTELKVSDEDLMSIRASLLK